jgi:ElaB/YqjD/DUF883 family membrane-anchored ribosome-binding protein
VSYEYEFIGTLFAERLSWASVLKRSSSLAISFEVLYGKHHRRRNKMTDNTQFGGSGSGQTTGNTGSSGIPTNQERTHGLTTTGTGAGTGAATAPKLAAAAREYGDKIAEAATTAKDYVADKAAVVTDKIKDLSNKDFGEVATEAKEYARKNPGQAILISAAAGLVLGLLIRGSRR